MLWRELLERRLEHLQVIVGVVGAGVAGPQDRGQHLTPARGQQRVKPEPALVVAGRELLVRMRGDRRRVEVEYHLLGRRPDRPCPRPGLRGAQPVQLCLAHRQKHPPRRRDRRHLPEQRRLGSERDQIRHAAPAVGQHHRQITEHLPRIVRRAALARIAKRPSKRVGQPEPLGRQRQQRGTRARREPRAVHLDFYLLGLGTSHHLQGAPPEPGREASRQRQLSLLRRTFQLATGANAARTTGESRLDALTAPALAIRA